MKQPADLARGWLLKAESDLRAAETLSAAGIALDAVCFHAQQAAEKALKAFLCLHATPFPFTHNLAKLIILCQRIEPLFAGLSDLADILTPYAVDSRYDDEFWPSCDDAAAALESAREIYAAAQTSIYPAQDSSPDGVV